MRFKVKGQLASSFIILLLFAVNSSLQAATVKIILSATSADSIKQADEIEIGEFISLPSNAAFSIGTFVADPDSNRAAIFALLSSGSAANSLNDSSIVLELDPTHPRSKFAGIWLTK